MSKKSALILGIVKKNTNGVVFLFFVLFCLHLCGALHNPELEMNRLHKSRDCGIQNTFFRPVFLMHGLADNDRQFGWLNDHIVKYHPDTPVFQVPIFNDEWSYYQLEDQAHALFIYTEQTMRSNNLTGCYHLVGHSQGGLLARAMVSLHPKHCVCNLVSLAGVQMGQYGLPPEVSQYIPKWLASLAQWDAHILLYTPLAQRWFGVANFWRDPFFLGSYKRWNSFLPRINNEVEHPSRGAVWDGMNRLKNMVVFGSPDDGVVIPPQSTIFGFFDEHGDMKDVYDHYYFEEDLFALKTLYNSDRLHIFWVPDVYHTKWVRREDMFTQYIIHFLD